MVHNKEGRARKSEGATLEMGVYSVQVTHIKCAFDGVTACIIPDSDNFDNLKWRRIVE